jgi:hypothetical protein
MPLLAKRSARVSENGSREGLIHDWYITGILVDDRSVDTSAPITQLSFRGTRCVIAAGD